MIQIRAHVYRDRVGFLICGRDAIGRSVRIFTETRVSAEHIRDKVKRGEQTELADFSYGAET